MNLTLTLTASDLSAFTKAIDCKKRILLEGNTFDGISVCGNCYEGRVQVVGGSYPVGVVIRNNHFGGGGESDGIQLGAPGVVVGPGNVFDGIVQGSYGRHVDAVQGYGQSRTTIVGNYFVRGDIYLMFPDGGNGEIIKDNVFDGGSGGNNGIGFAVPINMAISLRFRIAQRPGSRSPSHSPPTRTRISLVTW